MQHARQGAFVVNDFFESKGEIEEIAKEILELAISKHHGGLPDCIDESGNRAFLLGFTESDKSNEKYAYQEIKRGLNGFGARSAIEFPRFSGRYRLFPEEN